MMSEAAANRRIPVGAEVAPEGGVHFRVWAPRRHTVAVVLEGSRGPGNSFFLLDPEGDGYFSGLVREAAEGTFYRFRLDHDECLYPDPASRFQPDGPEGPSQVVDPSRFTWTDHDWQGITMEGQIIYEMHIGTYTPEGTFKAASRYLSDLANLGVTLIEVMPVAEFSGQFGWGYDGVDLYAPTRLYGTPHDFRSFVDQAHSAGIGIILDVVYNHLGPVGNYLNQFSLDYFTDRYVTEWGDAFNFDGPNSEAVREFIISNAGYWIDEFHLDGFRLDATQQIFDSSCDHVLAAITRHARGTAGARSIVVIAENEPQEVKLVRPPSEGGYGMDAIMNDDFHHTAMVALTGRNEAYYGDYMGTPQELVSSVKWGFLYQGQYYAWQNKRRGSPAFGIQPQQFIHFLQNHDQVANSPRGERCTSLTSPGRYRAMIALMLLTPQTPLLFQGQEFCSSSPFVYFADHHGELGNLVREGRSEFLMQFKSLTSQDIQRELLDPSDIGSFERSKLNHSERNTHRHIYSLHRDLLELRREDPVFHSQRTDWLHGAILGPEAFLLRFLGGDEGDRLILINLGRDIHFNPVPEPLIAPPENSHWELLWSSEAARYGGNGTPPIDLEGEFVMPGHAAIVFAPKRVVRAYHG